MQERHRQGSPCRSSCSAWRLCWNEGNDFVSCSHAVSVLYWNHSSSPSTPDSDLPSCSSFSARPLSVLRDTDCPIWPYPGPYLTHTLCPCSRSPISALPRVFSSFLSCVCIMAAWLQPCLWACLLDRPWSCAPSKLSLYMSLWCVW